VDTHHPSPVMMEVFMSSKVTKRKRRQFTPEFKAEAVRLVGAPGKNVAIIARELDLTATCLRAWVKQAAIDEQGTPQGALTTDERTELTRLRRELRTVEQERDFLKNSSVLCEEPVVKYAAIAAHVGFYAVTFMCRVLGVAPSGFYAWQQRSPSKKEVRDRVLTTGMIPTGVAEVFGHGMRSIREDRDD
jgi:transposase